MNKEQRELETLSTIMNTTVRSYLIEIARLPSKKTIDDQELSNACGLGLEIRGSEFAIAEMGRILEEISKYEVSQGRPMLSTIVTSKAGNYIRNLYFKIAEDLKLPGWNLMKNDMTLEMKVRAAVYTYWQNDANYLKYK